MPIFIAEITDGFPYREDHMETEEEVVENNETPSDTTRDVHEQPEEQVLQYFPTGSTFNYHLEENDIMISGIGRPRHGNEVLLTIPEQSEQDNGTPFVFSGGQLSTRESIHSSYLGNQQPSSPSSPSSLSSLSSLPPSKEQKIRHFIPYDIRNYIITLYEEYVIQYPKATIIDISKAIYEHYIQYCET